MRRIILIKGIFLIFSFLFLKMAHCEEIERVLSFHSDIKLNKDSSMVVTETIKVNVLGDKIKRGIYRDYPIYYIDSQGQDRKGSVRVIEVLRNGDKIAYKVENKGKYKRFYLGDFHTLLQPGEYTYTLAYKTNNHIMFNSDGEQLYYNVSGNQWAFPVLEASATVAYPDDIPQDLIRGEAYIGKTGSPEKNVLINFSGRNRITFVSGRGLLTGEGLTINIFFPKKSFIQKKLHDGITIFEKAISGAAAVKIGLVFILLYFSIAWFFVGMDPAKGEIIMRASPPQNISPALMRYILNMKYDDKVLTAALFSMASKGYLTVEEKKEGISILKNKNASKFGLSADEKAVAENLVSNSRVLFSSINYQKIKESIEALKKAVAKQGEEVYFKRNKKFFWPGFILSLVYLPVSLYLNSGSTITIMALVLVAVILINVLFWRLITAYTKKGRKLLDEIEGFKKYLLEKQKFADRSSYKNLEAYYEKYLAYAIALDIENIWDKFFFEFAALEKFKPESRIDQYCPGWYMGGHWTAGASHSLGYSMTNSYVTTPSPGALGTGSGGASIGRGIGGGCSGGGSGGGGGGGF